MKKLSLLFLVIFLPAITCLFSCKKVYHSPNPTPDNYRVSSYTKVTTQSILYPFIIPTPIVTENYSFLYDASNRVSQIFYTSNDSNKMKTGMADLSIKFFYVSDTIYKTSTDLKTSSIKELDTFIINSQGQIINSYFPNEIHAFQYYGKLLSNEMVGYRDTGTLITANVSYTSNNGDFLYRYFNGQLNVTFEDTGIRPNITPLDTVRDTVLSLPLSVTWTQFYNNGTTSSTNDNNLNAYTDNLNGYNQNYLIVTAVDPNGVTVRPGYFPAGYCAQQFYQIYDYLTNRPGDYLQLQSFSTYGVNIYQQTHMFKSLTTPYISTSASYTIDGDSKVTYTNVVTRDSLLKNITTEAYKLQYSTY
jgi:hypothetical protein